MGYISKKLDLAGDWYPSGRLWRHAATFVSMELGFVLILYMEVEWNVHGLRPESGVPYLLYFFVVMVAIVMSMQFLLAMKILQLRRQTLGREVRTFEGASFDAMAEEVERMLREGGHYFTEDQPPRGLVGFLSPSAMYHRWFRVMSGNLNVVVGSFLGTSGTPVFVGPRGLLNAHLVDDIQNALEDKFGKDRVTVTEEPPSKDVATGSPVVLPMHQE